MGNEKQIVSVKISDIDVSQNVRGKEVTGWTHLGELVRSIEENGQRQPVELVDLGKSHSPRYECVSGHLRIEACRMLGEQDVLAIVSRAKDLSRAQRAAIRLAENMCRVQLTAIEEARALNAMLGEEGQTIGSVAKRIGISERRVGERLRMLRLPESVRDKVESGEIGASAAAQLARAPALAEDLADCNATVDEINERVRRKTKQPRQQTVDGQLEPGPRRGRPREMRSKAEARELLAELRRRLAAQEGDVDVVAVVCRVLEWLLCEREELFE